MPLPILNKYWSLRSDQAEAASPENIKEKNKEKETSPKRESSFNLYILNLLGGERKSREGVMSKIKYVSVDGRGDKAV